MAQFAIEWVRLAVHFPGLHEQDVVIGTLTPVDLVRVASLIVMVMLSATALLLTLLDRIAAAGKQ